MLTIKEIEEQPKKFEEINKSYFELSRDVVMFLERENPKEISFVGCGTSYYLAMGLSFQINRMGKGKIRSRYLSGSEIAFGLEKFEKGTVLIGLSRSGESSETVAALKRAKKDFGLKTVAISCEAESSITKVADVSVVLNFINEKSVVMTQSFTSMAFFTSALIRDLFDHKILEDYLKSISKKGSIVLSNSKELFEGMNFKNYEHFVFLGYDEYFAASMEGVVKVTETSLSEVDAFQTLEYRHGPKSKVRSESLVCVLANSVTHSEEEKVAKEIESLGGTVINISSKKMSLIHNIIIPYENDDFGDWFLKVIPAQLIGVKRAEARGLNPDTPKNLTRVVKL